MEEITQKRRPGNPNWGKKDTTPTDDRDVWVFLYGALLGASPALSAASAQHAASVADAALKEYKARYK